jgi:hypothetical protein
MINSSTPIIISYFIIPIIILIIALILFLISATMPLPPWCLKTKERHENLLFCEFCGPAQPVQSALPIQGAAIFISDDEIPSSSPSGLEIRSNPLSAKGYAAQGAKNLSNARVREKYQAKEKPSAAAPPPTKQKQSSGSRIGKQQVYIGVALIVVDFYYLSEDDRKWNRSRVIKRDTPESK